MAKQLRADKQNEDRFYRDLPVIRDFPDVFSEASYHPVPESWWIVMTDVVGSTKAIEAGKYKDVNSAGSLSAMAISNYFGHMDFPFIFGGDGMTCLVPGSAEPAVRLLLSGVGPVVKLAFDLELRLAMVPVAAVLEQGKVLRIARLAVSPQFTQAIVDGDGLDYAESLMKTPGSPFLLPPPTPDAPEPNLYGYSCRWQDYPSQKDETIALIVKFRVKNRKYLQDFMQLVDRLIGQPKEHHPLTPERSEVFLDVKKYEKETLVVFKTNKGIVPFLYKRTVKFFTRLFLLAEKLRLPLYFGKKNLANTRTDNVACSDYRKFDNSLKMIVAVTKETRAKIEKLLAQEYAKDRIFYGVHVSDRAMITCLMQASSGQEVHFVDAADGGYAFAAKQLKEQVKLAAAPPKS